MATYLYMIYIGCIRTRLYLTLVASASKIFKFTFSDAKKYIMFVTPRGLRVDNCRVATNPLHQSHPQNFPFEHILFLTNISRFFTAGRANLQCVSTFQIYSLWFSCKHEFCCDAKFFHQSD